MYVTQTRRAVTSEFIRWCLETAGLKHEQAADITGWSRRTITAWARGERVPADSDLEMFCKGIGASDVAVQGFYVSRGQALARHHYQETDRLSPWSEI